MILGFAVIALVIGTVLFHFLSPWWFTPIASNWTTMDQTVDITFWVTGIVFIAINLFMAYAIIRYRHRQGLKAHYEPENKKLEWWLTIVTSVGIAAMLAPGLLVWAKFVTVPRIFASRVRRIRSRSTPATPRARTMSWCRIRNCTCLSANR
jgi:cytochrome c oxidase subunit 2